MIEKNRHYLWAFGDNTKGQRALSVQLKKDIIDFPDVAFVPAESRLGDAIGYIT
jgi:5-formyltetrahydrofolate cyclo-ligase